MSFKKRILFLGSAMLFSAFAAPALATCIPQGAWSAGSFRDGIPLCAADLNNNNAYLSSLFSPATLLGNPNTWTARQTFTGVTLSNITGLTQCLDVNSSGIVSGAGSNCLLGSNNLGDVQSFSTALNNLSGLPHFANNSALTALPHTAYATVIRDGFAAVADAPQLPYTSSASPCSIASGAGDGGAQVPTSDGGCWIANWTSTTFDVREWGAKCDWNGSTGTDDTTVLGKAESYVESAPGGSLFFARMCVGDITVASNNIRHVGKQPPSIAAGASGLVANSLTSAAVTIGAVSGYTAQNMLITSKSQQTSGKLIYFNGGNTLNLYDVLVTHGYDNIETDGVNIVNIQGGGSRDFMHRAWYATALSTALFFSNWVADEDSSTACLSGSTPIACTPVATFEGDYGSAWQFGNGVFLAHGHCDLKIDPGEHQYVDWPEFLPGATLDATDFSGSGGSNLCLSATGTGGSGGGIINGGTFRGWMGSPTGNNVVATTDTGNGSSISGVAFGGEYIAAGTQAMSLMNAVGTSIDGATIAGASQSSSTTYAAIDLDGTTTLVITGGKTGPYEGYGASMKSAIQTESTFTGYVRCTGMDVSGNATAGWTNAAASPDFAAVNCKGINGLGVQAVTPNTSPWTYTNNDGVPETLVAENGTGTLSGMGYSGAGHNLCTAAPCSMPLNPGQSGLVTYSGGTITAFVNRQ